MQTPKTDCDVKPALLAYNRLQNAIRIRGAGVAKLVFGLQQSLDGYVDHAALGPPGPGLFRHFEARVRDVAGTVYGRRTYEIMQYWEKDQEDWDAQDRDFAAAWRHQSKWVVSHTLKSVGTGATLIQGDLAAAIRALKAEYAGEIDIAGPDLARSLAELGLIDEYRLYFRPVVLGHGTPFFASARPPLRFVSSDIFGEDAIRLTYVPA
jgi:dihydrofolate reductase